jgi:hypothetical protein
MRYLKPALSILILLALAGCAGSAQLASNDPFSYFDQKDLNLYYFSHNCTAALCNPH